MEQARSADEIGHWAWEREPHEREPVPEPGERLLFRPAEWAQPVPAIVLEVQDMTRHNDGHGGTDPDPHVWGADGELRDDPWPWVTMRLGDDPESGPLARAKEARVRGSAGWLRPGSRWA